jgi:hypothetical protein
VQRLRRRVPAHRMRYAVRGTRFTVHGSRCIVGRDRGAKRECESWTRAGEDGAGSVRAPQRSASLSSKTSKMAARPSSAAQRRWQACFRLAGAAAAGPSADGDESRRRGMVARGERERERERERWTAGSFHLPLALLRPTEYHYHHSWNTSPLYQRCQCNEHLEGSHQFTAARYSADRKESRRAIGAGIDEGSAQRQPWIP